MARRIRAHRPIAHRIQLSRDAAQELNVHLVQTRSLEARVDSVGELIVDTWDLDFSKGLAGQVKGLLGVVDGKGFEGGGFVAEERLEEIGVEDDVELAIEHGQRRELEIGVHIAGYVRECAN